MNKNQENAERMQQLVDDLNLKTEKIKLGKEKIAKTRYMKIIANRLTCVCVKKKGGGEAARQRHLSRKKMLPRDR